MKNITSLKPNDTNSPKTPGGIRKSLLTPCRRLGLSRNWRKSGSSPFISPLAATSSDVTESNEMKNESRKRKERLPDENTEVADNNIENVNSTENIENTHSRNVSVPRKKKSKTLLTSINEAEEQDFKNVECKSEPSLQEPKNRDLNCAEHEVVSTPVRTKSKRSKKQNSPGTNSAVSVSPKQQNSPVKNSEVSVSPKPREALVTPTTICDSGAKNAQITYTVKEKSPNDLSKECVVVIQRKMFKNSVKDNKTSEISTKEEQCSNTIDSDSDEAPLINIQKQNSVKSNDSDIKDKMKEEDDDFIDSKTSKAKSKTKNTKSPKNKQKATKPVKTKLLKESVDVKHSQMFLEDDDDDDFDNKKTILIKRTYEKVTKPIKAKSTGSISQKDIDNLRNRIEAKKKLLLAQSLTPDTEELRNLIKKWQKGCQDALMELLDLMRNKFPDKANMDYSEMLQTLKIPPTLVGYDSENDCFLTPDDASIILGQFKDV